MAMLIAASCGAMTSCSVSDNEKTVEVVDDPIKDVVEYYISGKVTEGTATLSGVNIDVNGTTATTDANGEFKVTMTEKGSFTVTASKDGYLKVSGMAVTIPANASNRSVQTLNFSMTKKAASVALPEADNKTMLITDGKATADQNMSNVEKGTGLVIPAEATAAIEEGTTVSMTEYVPEQQAAAASQGTQEVSAAIMNVYVESNKDIAAKGVILAIKNPVPATSTSFQTLDVYASSNARAGESYQKIGEAKLNTATNSYQYTLTEGKLAGDYSFRIKAKRTVSAAKEESITSGKVDNSGNFEAKKDVKIAYEAPMGWTYTKAFDSSLDANLVTLMKNAINAQEGTEGTYKTKFEHTTNVSGNSIMYYEAKSLFTTNSYVFELTNSKTTSVELKKYNGTSLYYTNETADQHSGGTSE